MIEEEEVTIIYTDRSKRKEGKATGAAIAEEREEEKEGFYMSMDKRCMVFTAEAAAITKAIQK